MKKLLVTLLITLLLPGGVLLAQNAYDLVIKGGHVIDAKNHIDGVMDVAIKDGKIAAVSDNIEPTQATQTIDATGLYITPGLIDIHAHVFWGHENSMYENGYSAIQPDGFTFRNGVTTVVDAGGSGWRTFPIFKRQTIDHSQTRVLAFLNISGEGMEEPDEQNLNDMDPKMSALVATQNKDIIVGFKLAHYNGHTWEPADRAIKAGELAGNIPIMVDFGGAQPALSIKELFLEHFRPGDIFTHCFAQLGPSRESIYDVDKKKLKPFVWEARKKGIVFDVGYGGISFAFSQAIPSIKEGFYPNSISTDLHIGSMNAAMKDMLTTMTKFLAMGMPLNDVIAASTWNPAQEIQREELGNLSVGAGADVAILALKQGNFGLFDYVGYKLNTNQKLECELTIRDGKIVYDLNGIANPLVVKNGRKFINPQEAFARWYNELGASNGLHLSPSASINHAEFFRQYKRNPTWWNEAFNFLNNKDLINIKPGVYVIDSGNVIATVSEGPAKEINDVQWEAHRDFNDLQYIIRGTTKMGVASVNDAAAVLTQPYSYENGDVMHFKNDDGNYYDATPDVFFIFSPLEMHRPAVRVPGNNKIKKIVIKVRVPGLPQ